MEKNGFVVVDRGLREVFEPYIAAADPPSFVTTDSLWHAFTILVEEGLRQMEEGHARVMRAFCARMVESASAGGDTDLLAFAKAARELLDTPRPTLPEIDFLSRRVPDHALAPVGAYASSPELAGYFRARQWLAQNVLHDRRLERLLADDRELASLHAALVRPFARIAGERTDLAADEWAVLPQRLTLDAELLRATTHPRVPGRWLPTGLEITGIGPLASRAGLRALGAIDARARDATPGELGTSLFDDSLRVLRTLQDPLPDRAPAVLRTDAWRDKQLSTQLAAWSQLRHALALHAVETRHFRGIADGSRGYVEPYPWFFTGVARLAHSYAELLARGPALSKDELVTGAKEVLAIFELKRTEYRRGAAAYWRFWSTDWLNHPEEDQRDVPFERIASDVETRMRAVAAGAEPDAPTRKRIAVHVRRGPDVAALLRELADLCQRLARIAVKQLAAEDLDTAEDELLRDYGKELARFCLYSGNSYLGPRDDHPRVASVAASLEPDRTSLHECLLVGTARPELLLIYIEREGQRVLHRGAVLSYREMRANAPLTDEAWRALLRTDAAPKPPAFTASFRR